MPGNFIVKFASIDASNIDGAIILIEKTTASPLTITNHLEMPKLAEISPLRNHWHFPVEVPTRNCWIIQPEAALTKKKGRPTDVYVRF